jgi:hypothetical protein
MSGIACTVQDSGQPFFAVWLRSAPLPPIGSPGQDTPISLSCPPRKIASDQIFYVNADASMILYATGQNSIIDLNG